MLNDLFQQGVAVKILHGIAAGEHTEHSLILDLALALAEDRHRDVARKTRNRPESIEHHPLRVQMTPSASTRCAAPGRSALSMMLH
ncbi:hypothetical protein B0T44_20440 [Nocardia donostiensis]|uniref:Resolvase/invertase-type recombinase catalytic domain-containing protein n=1 Tax=Nocardia donostiensis TaxID=1538463 RepID=A0A1W0B1E2_9NOCA|nr:hypothetical protein B0T46_23100 [Nocardia donostiensis]OQS16315.1 hypothetical protein B0T36_06025 [Nocardia donostiensis]OQS18298.1 hypothetical protein B0T44_20440 [Nocardia donostiensis]